MSEAIVAKRYAEALFQLGTEKGSLDQLVEELQIVQDVFQGNQELYMFLKHPRVTNANKKQFLQEVFQGLSTDVINTIKILVERHRVEVTPSIIDHFIGMVNDAEGIAEAKVYSVRELSDAEKQELENSFAKRFNKKAVKFKNIIDPSLMGGLRIRMGNTIFDGSISGKLQRIERDIVTANK